MNAKQSRNNFLGLRIRMRLNISLPFKFLVNRWIKEVLCSIARIKAFVVHNFVFLIASPMVFPVALTRKHSMEAFRELFSTFKQLWGMTWVTGLLRTDLMRQRRRKVWLKYEWLSNFLCLTNKASSDFFGNQDACFCYSKKRSKNVDVFKKFDIKMDNLSFSCCPENILSSPTRSGSTIWPLSNRIHYIYGGARSVNSSALIPHAPEYCQA